MEIDRNSWHYKMLKKKRLNESTMPKDICSYFRAIIIRLIVGYIIPYSILAIIGISTSYTIYTAIMDFSYFNEATYPLHKIMFIITFMTSVVIAVAVLLGSLIHLSLKFDDFKRTKRKSKGESNNIIKAYFKAKHEKLCTTIKFTGGK